MAEENKEVVILHWNPQPDITTFELSCIFHLVNACGNGISKESFSNLDGRLKRHFKAVKTDIKQEKIFSIDYNTINSLLHTVV